MIRVRRPPELGRLGRRHTVVEASAGTGKTYLLEHLVVDLILRQGVELEQILVVTFTEKAAAELVQRVRGKLGQLKDLGAEDALARAGAAAPEEECWVLDERARQRLQGALLGFDRAAISTIHAFCQRLLGEHAFLQRRLFDEELVDEEEAFHTAFLETLRREVAPDPKLSPYLSAWLRGGSVAALETLLLRTHRVLTGTTTLRPPPFDEEALAEALAAVPPVDPNAAAKGWYKAHRIVAQTASAIDKRLVRLGRIVEARQAGAAVVACLAALDAEDGKDGDLLGYLCTKLGDVREGPLEATAAAVRRLAAASVPLASALVHRVLPLVQVRLEQRKRQAGLFDFQDILSLLARALDGDDARARELRATLRARFRHALIDEFQDTDEVQWSIFRRLFMSEGGVLTVIGDPKQAIYGFRGADVHTYLKARADLAGPEGPLHLTASYRATAPLIRATNALLDQQGTPPFFRRDGGIRYDHPVVCGRPELALLDGERPAAPVVVLDVETTQPSLLTWQVKQALLARMVGEVQALLARPLTWRTAEGDRPLRASDLYVVTRTTRESREVGDALRAARIPFAFFKQEKLFETVEAREVLDLLRAIADPDDHTARARAWITGFFGLSLPELAACETLPPGHPLLRLLYEWNALADAGEMETLFARIVEESGIVCREVFLRDSERALTNYLHLIELLQAEAARTRGSVRELAQTLAAWVSGARRPASDIQRLETDALAVQIMTIHHAKGLEAPVVFVYGGFWPGPRNEVRVFHEEERTVVRVGRLPADEAARWEVEQEDEEARVFYVALTRARGRLYLPRYPAAFKTLRGAYKLVNQRLNEVLGAFSSDEVRALFSSTPVPCPAPPLLAALAPGPVLAAWRPPPALLADDPPDDLGALAAARAGFMVTSYSALKRRGPEADDPAAGEAPAEALERGPAPDELPRGRLSGSFLHELLEEVPLAGVREGQSLEAWRADREVRALFDRLGRRHDRHPAHRAHAERLVYTAFTAGVGLGSTTIDGLASAPRAVREMEFLYPIPERAHPLLGDEDGRFAIERGVVKGFIDLLFEHEGRAYVCDWKGDWLPAFDSPALRAHSARHYETQARLYTLAALRLLRVKRESEHEARFGGVLFCFLRGMGPGAGVDFQRPSWAEVQSWEREMLSDSFWRMG